MLKKILMAALLFIMVIAAKADDDQKITSRVEKVIVFLNGAQVTRKAMVNINAGTSDLIFGEISPGIDAQSIQVLANGDFTILSVKQEFNYLNPQVNTKQADELRIAQKSIRDKIDLQNSLLSVYEAEEATLMKNQFVKAENTTLDVIKLKQALDFQTDRLTSIKEKELTIKNQLITLGTELQKYDEQISEMNNGSPVTKSNIVVTVSAKAALQASFTLSYVVRNAGWLPMYDIKAKNVSSPLSITYKAKVSQTSGEDWKNVKLTLSTGNPSISAIKPELSPYYLNLTVNYLQGRASGALLNEVVVADGYASERKDGRIQGTNPVGVRQVENQTNVEFNIDNPYSIASDGKQCLVEIGHFDIKASYQYYVAPKINTNVFLTAQITDWNKYNFLPGEANLFFEGTYIGKSLINTQAISDTLDLSLGTDKSILVTRILKNELTEKQGLGSNKKEIRNWLINIKNRKTQPVNLLVEDQVPVSQNSSIEVEVQDASGVKPDPLTGRVSWNVLLNPQGDKKLELKYQVKYPKNQSIIVQ